MALYTPDGPWYSVPFSGGITRVPSRLAAGMLVTRQRSRCRERLSNAPASAGLTLAYHGTLDALRARAQLFRIWQRTTCPCCGQLTDMRRTLHPRLQARLRLLRDRYIHRYPVTRSPLP